MTTNTVILKLGGSVITHKNQVDTVNEAALTTAVDAIADSTVHELIIVHGGGGFGHSHAVEHGVSRTQGTYDSTAIVDIHSAMKNLNTIVITRLHEVSVSALPVHPLSFCSRDSSGTFTCPVTGIASMIEGHFVPVLHGDVIPESGEGVTIVSGDELVVSLAESLNVSRVGMCSDVPGVLDDSGEVIPEIRDPERIGDLVGPSGDPDVTGGMATKVNSLVDLDAEAAIFDLESLPRFLAGELPGTRFL